ncbi:MAG: hypothetical protein ACOYIF_03580 [Acetivibrionales bacterium]|jgi:hypothetical protein
MVLSLDYGNLSSMISATNKLSNELGQYCDDLGRKVQNKMYTVEGGMSAALNSADYYVNAKIKQLRNRESNARDLSLKMQTLLDTAKRVDSDIESTIKANRVSFFEKNPELKAPWYEQVFTSFMIDMKNVPLIGALIKGCEEVNEAIEQLCQEIRHWWKCGGGKELITNCIDIVVKIGLAVAACMTAFVAITTGAAFLVVCAFCYTAIIAAINAGANIVTSVQAIGARNIDPAMSKIYSERDSFADVIREENFHDELLNRGSNAVSTFLDLSETVCDVIIIGRDIGKAGKNIKEIFAGKTIREMFNNLCIPRDSRGRFISGELDFRNGIRSIRVKFSKSFNIKNWVLGNLQLPDNYKRLGRKKKLGYIAKMVRASSKTFDNFNKVLKGEQSLSRFAVSRVTEGFYKNMATNKDLSGPDKLNPLNYKYADLDHSRIFSNAKTIIDKTGFTKLITDIDKSGNWSYMNNSTNGLIQKARSIIESAGEIDTTPKFETYYPYYCITAQGGGNL